jgi:hypothetical protein
MNMEVRRGIAMHFIVHLYWIHNCGHGSRDVPDVSHERRALRVCEVMQLYRMSAKDQANVATDRIIGADENPRSLELGERVCLAATHLTVHTATLSFPFRDISPATHMVVRMPQQRR